MELINSFVNFSDDKWTFGMDLRQVIDDIFCKFNMQRMEFNVVCGNPIEKSYDRIRAIKEMIGNRNILLSVDGGVGENNVRKLEQCGNTMVVAGSSVFKAQDRKQMIDKLRG